MARQFIYDIRSQDIEQHLLKGERAEPTGDVASDSFRDIPSGQGRKEQITGIGGQLWKPRAGNAGYEFMPVTLNGVALWNPIIRASGRKTVVETPMVDRGGSVKEIISLDDYVISIRGTIKRQDGYWPDAEIAELLDVWRLNEAIPIESALTGRLLNGNEYVVITHLDFPDRQGFVESIDYSIECVSDIPFMIELNENSEYYGNV